VDSAGFKYKAGVTLDTAIVIIVIITQAGIVLSGIMLGICWAALFTPGEGIEHNRGSDAKRKEVKGLYTEAIGDDVDLDRFELGSCGPFCKGENSVVSFDFNIVGVGKYFCVCVFATSSTSSTGGQAVVPGQATGRIGPLVVFWGAVWPYLEMLPSWVPQLAKLDAQDGAALCYFECCARQQQQRRRIT